MNSYRSQPYTFNKVINGINGSNGVNGKDGLGISSIVPQYYLSTSSTTQSGGSWGTAQPIWSAGKYIWTRSLITWKDNTTTTTTPVIATTLNDALGNIVSLDNTILAWCYNNDKTYINGSKIYAKSITSSQLSTDAIKSNNYVANSVGSFLNLADGSFDSKYLKWTKEGVITATSGSIAGIKINTTSLTASVTSGDATIGYEITNAGNISIYNRGSGIDYNLYLNAEQIRIQSYGTVSGSNTRDAYLEDSALTFKYLESKIGYIYANNNAVLELYGKSGIVMNSNLTCANVNLTTSAFAPLTITRSGSVNASAIKFVNSNGTLGFIGMANGVNSGLKRWTADASTPYDIIDGTGGNIVNNSDTALNVTGGIKTRMISFSNDKGSIITARTGGGFDFFLSASGTRIVFDGDSGKIFRVSASGTWTALTN